MEGEKEIVEEDQQNYNRRKDQGFFQLFFPFYLFIYRYLQVQFNGKSMQRERERDGKKAAAIKERDEESSS